MSNTEQRIEKLKTGVSSNCIQNQGLSHILDRCNVQMKYSNNSHFFCRECFGKPIVWDAANGEQCDEHDERFWQIEIFQKALCE